MVGLGLRSFFRQKDLYKSRRHLFLFVSSLSIVVQYNTGGKHFLFFQGSTLSDIFDVLYYIALTIISLQKVVLLVNLELDLKQVDPKLKSDSLLNDRSITSVNEDELTRSDFAKDLANELLKSDGNLTMGIYGAWGTGKSSFITMMKEHIDPKQTVIEFTPWYFGENNHDIILAFLDLLVGEIKESKSFNTKLEKEIKKYADFFKTLQIRPIGGIVKVGELFQGFFPEETDLADIKSSIDNLLKQSDQKIIVFIDDLDRLDRSEIAVVFKLIRLVCDFPNIVYVLALDEEVVSLALGQVYGDQKDEMKAIIKGREYLEKFIQVPVYLPQADERKLKEILLRGIEDILVENKIKSDFIESNKHFYPIIEISKFGLSLRNIKRYINLLRIFVPVLHREVFVDDLLYLLLLKVCSPGLYDWIRTHPHLILQKEKAFYINNLELKSFTEEYKEYQRVLEELFPNLGYVFNGTLSRKRVSSELPNSQLLISNQMYFQKYFMYTTPYKQISQKELQSFYSGLTEKQDDLTFSENKLNELIAVYSLEEVFRKMRNDVSVLPADILLQLLTLLNSVHVKSNEVEIRREIEKLIFTIYLDRRDILVKSELFIEPINLLLMVKLSLLIKQNRVDDKMTSTIFNLVKRRVQEQSLHEIFTSIPTDQQYIILGYYIENEQDDEIRRAKISEVIKSVETFKEILETLIQPQMDDINFYQKVLENVNNKIIERYIKSINEQDEDDILLQKLKKGQDQAIHYLNYELGKLFESGKSQKMKIFPTEDFTKQILLFSEAQKNHSGIEIMIEYIEEIIAFNNSSVSVRYSF